jgi:hypothetical protein
MEDVKMQKTISIVTATLTLILFSTVSSAHADRKTMEGFIIGTGVAMLGAAIINGMNNNADVAYTPHHSKQHDYNYNGQRYKSKNRSHRQHYKGRHRGHWEIEKIWIEPVYETKWNPGHYNRRGKWINGRHEKFLVAKGWWQESKVWVRR